METAFLYSLYVKFLCSHPPLEKAFCQAGEADIQDYVSAQNVIAWIFLHTYYYYGEADVRTDRPCSAAFV